MITLEYSARQDCFHISTLDAILKINIRNTINKVDNDYKIVGLFETQQEASKMAEKLRKKQEEVDKKD